MRRRPILVLLASAVLLLGCEDTSTEGGPAPLDETTDAPDSGDGSGDDAGEG